MNRRRFVPALDGLEARQLLSTTAAAAPQATSSDTAVIRAAQANPNSQTAWQVRVDRLPAFLRSVNRNRIVPPDLILALQNDLRAIATTLHPPPSGVLQQFNEQLQNTLPHASLQPSDAAGLNRSFGLVLEKSGAAPDLVAQFQQNMKEPANVDAAQINPALTAANDYATVLQMALGVGFVRPVQAAKTPAARTPASPRSR